MPKVNRFRPGRRPPNRGGPPGPIG